MDNRVLGDRLQNLRKTHGYSQEQLADLVGVSRQAVSKWESGASLPDIDNLVRISALYGQSLDSIVKGTPTEPGQSTAEPVLELDGLSSEIVRMRLTDGWGYEYKSRATLFGVPLVHVNIGKRRGRLRVARGIVAVGSVACGVVSVGILSFGLLSLGVLSAGLLASLGILSVGALSAGIVAAGLLSFGTVALGYFAVGVTAMGVYSGGVATVASRVAVGVAANAPVAIGRDEVHGLHTLLVASTQTADPMDSAFAVRRFIETYAPGTSNWILNRLVSISQIL